MGLRLTVLGSAAAWAERPGRPSSAYLIEHPEGAIVLDLGQGALNSVFGQRDPSTLDAVVISHEHSDHHVDLIPLRHLLRYGYDEPRRIGLHVPDELRRRYDVFPGEADFLHDLSGPDLVAGKRDIGPFGLDSRPVTHSELSYAFRVTSAAPTEPLGSSTAAIAGAPTISSHSSDRATRSSARRSGARASRSPAQTTSPRHRRPVQRSADEAGQLVLTHVLDAHDPQAAVDAAREVFPGPVELAELGSSSTSERDMKPGPARARRSPRCVRESPTS